MFKKASIWRPIIGYEGSYEISALGQVRSLDRFCDNGQGSMRFLKGKILKAGLGGNDYYTVALSGKTQYVHRLVAENWLLSHKLEHDIVINHKDGNKLNNHWSNLEWCSWSHNNTHAIETGLRGYNVKVTWEQVLEIRAKENNAAEIASEYCISKSYVNEIKRGGYRLNQTKHN